MEEQIQGYENYKNVFIVCINSNSDVTIRCGCIDIMYDNKVVVKKTELITDNRYKYKIYLSAEIINDPVLYTILYNVGDIIIKGK